MAALLLAACTPSAGEDAALTLYNGRSPELISPLLAQFTADTGIAVEVRSAGSGELAAQLLTEGAASPADAFLSQDAGALGALGKDGALAPLPAEALDRVPEAYRAADGSWLGLSGRVRVLVYHPGLVPHPPETIDELVSGQYVGRIGFAPTNASWQSFVTGLRMLRGEQGARSWLESFAKSEPAAFEGNAQVRDAVDSGAVSLGLVNHYYLHELIDQRGPGKVTARNQFLAPGDPGGLVNVAGIGILASSDQPAQARALVDYLTSSKAQEYFAQETAEYPLVAGVPGRPGLPDLASLAPPQLDLSDLDSIRATQDLLADVGLLTM